MPLHRLAWLPLEMLNFFLKFELHLCTVPDFNWQHLILAIYSPPLERFNGSGTTAIGDSETSAAAMTTTPPWLTDMSSVPAARGRGRSTTL